MSRDNLTIRGFLKPYHRLITAIVLLQILGAFGTVESLMLMKPILNKGIYADDMHEFFILVTALIALTLLIAIVLIITTKLSSRVATNVAESLRLAIMNATLSVNDLSSLGASPTDAMVCLINDVASVQRYVFETLRTYLPMPILLTLLLGYTFYTNFTIGVIMALTVVIVAGISFVFTVRLRPLYVEQLKWLGVINTSLREKVLGARTIRAYNGYQYEVDKFFERSAVIGKINRIIAMNSYYVPNIATACMWIFIVILFVASALEEGKALDASEIIIFMQFATTIVANLSLISYFCIDAPRARTCFMHISDLITKARMTKKAIVDPDETDDTDNCLVAEDLVLRDRFGGFALDDVDLKIPKGKTVTLLGPNGSGASHLIRIALGFETPESGRLLINGLDTSNTDPRKIRSDIAYANSSLGIIRGTIRFNLDPHEVHSDGELLMMCKRIGLDDYISSLPDGLDTKVHHAVSSMSGGQKLLVILARCLLKDVDLYIFDDCFFSLDNNTKDKVTRTISEVCAGKSVIFHMHDTSTCEISDDVILMAGGKVVDHGTHSELLETSKLYNDLYKTGQGRHGSWA